MQTQTARLQRTTGSGRLALRHLDGRTRLGRLYQEGAAKIRLPRTYQGDALDAVLINTAGGLTGGDRFDWTIDLGSGTAATITTQACEKIYRASGDQAEVDIQVSVGPRGRLAWLPQETILFDRSALSRRLRIDLAPDAGLLLVEPVIFGRQAMGETPRQVRFRDRWHIRRGGRLLHAEAFRLEGDAQAMLARPSVSGGKVAVATLLLVHPDAEALVDPLRRILGNAGGVSAMRSAAGDRLVARLVADSGLALRRVLIPAIERCNRFLIGGARGLPKLWTI